MDFDLSLTLANVKVLIRAVSQNIHSLHVTEWLFGPKSINNLSSRPWDCSYFGPGDFELCVEVPGGREEIVQIWTAFSTFSLVFVNNATTNRGLLTFYDASLRVSLYTHSTGISLPC